VGGLGDAARQHPQVGTGALRWEAAEARRERERAESELAAVTESLEAARREASAVAERESARRAEAVAAERERVDTLAGERDELRVELRLERARLDDVRAQLEAVRAEAAELRERAVAAELRGR
ncbi:hypothetical protein ABZS51_21310, partial [Nonomuraea sp. NPDC005501]